MDAHVRDNFNFLYPNTPRTVIYKSADETVNNSSTLQNDDDLLFAVGANEVWAFICFIRQDSGTLPDFKHAWTVPTDAVMSRGIGHQYTDLAAQWLAHDDATTPSASYGGKPITTVGCVVVSTTAGNVQLQWAQNQADVSDTKCEKGSWLIAWRLM